MTVKIVEIRVTAPNGVTLHARKVRATLSGAIVRIETLLKEAVGELSALWREDSRRTCKNPEEARRVFDDVGTPAIIPVKS